MKVYISGSHGLIGTALKHNLESDGHQVVRIPRNIPQSIDFNETDAIVHLAGENIAEGRWTAEKKRKIEESRVGGTKRLAGLIAESSEKPSVFISASAIGYYGNRGDETLDESSEPGDDFLSNVCKRWEEATNPAVQSNIRTVQIRTGVVLSDKGGALKKMLPPFKMGAGGILGNGRQYMSWISLDEIIGAIRFIIGNEKIQGPVNLVSPNPVTNREFTKTLGSVIHRPTIMPMPGFAARLLFGEMADALLLSSTKVMPKRLMEAGYSFKHANLDSALKSIFQ